MAKTKKGKRVFFIIILLLIIFFIVRYTRTSVKTNESAQRLRLDVTTQKSEDERKSVVHEVRPQLTGDDPLDLTWSIPEQIDTFPAFDFFERIQLSFQLNSFALFDFRPEFEKGSLYTKLQYLDSLSLDSKLVSAIRSCARLTAFSMRMTKTKDEDLSSDVYDLLSKANSYYEKMRISQSIPIYNKILRLVPFHSDARNNLGLAYMHLGQNAMALYQLQLLSTLVPHYEGVDNNLVALLCRMDLFDEAHQIAQSIVKSGNKAPMVLYNLAWIEHCRGNYQISDVLLQDSTLSVNNFTKAKMLRVLNALESGKKPNKEDLSVFPRADRIRLQKINPYKVEVTSETANLYDNEYIVVNRVNKGRQFVVSQSSPDWYCVYYINKNRKLRLWIPAVDVKMVDS